MRIGRACVVIALGLLTGCKHATSPWPSSRLNVADPRTFRQLIFGFYELSDDRWRWTAPSFAVALAVPPVNDKSQYPAAITADLFFPQDEVDQLGPITLRAAISNVTLGSETFYQGGPHHFKAKVPRAKLITNVLPVTFTLDKFLPRSFRDSRDLGVVVTNVSVEPLS